MGTPVKTTSGYQALSTVDNRMQYQIKTFCKHLSIETLSEQTQEDLLHNMNLKTAQKSW